MTREEAIKDIRDNIKPIVGGKSLDMAIEALEWKHGEWLETSESIGWEEVGCAECSVCGKTLVLGDYTMDDIKFNYNYCPNCGADMRGGDANV